MRILNKPSLVLVFAVAATLFSQPLCAAGAALPASAVTSAQGPGTTGETTDNVQLAGEDRPLKIVHISSEAHPAVKIAAQACAGLWNRESGGSVFTRMNEKDAHWMAELSLEAGEMMNAGDFVHASMTQFPRCVRYSYAEQQELLPNILTIGAVLGAIPVAVEMDVPCENIVFDATVVLKDYDTPYLATKYVYENFVNETTGLAMLNPGYPTRGEKVWNPELSGDMNPVMIDFVFSEKLFTMFLVNGCIKCTWEHDLLNDIVSVNPWPKPIGVYGYANYWMVFGGYLFEAQTLCARPRNMGAIPTSVNNLSFFSTRREPITEPDDLRANELEGIDYNPGKTYVAFIVGDGDNIAFMLGMRVAWLRQRAEACRGGDNSCPPLTWTISPHLARIAPDVLQWYYTMGRETGNDYFMLPPSGHLYAYPSSLDDKTMQDKFVEATEADARLLGTQSTVHWEAFWEWRYAENSFLPKYAGTDAGIKGVFPVNVPYMFPTGTWKSNQFFKLIDGQERGKVVLFRPRQWRGVHGNGIFMDKAFYVSPEEMASELGAYPRGTVTAIYMTSDGGLNLNNSVMELVKMLPEHVRLVSADTAVELALEASKANN
ncbi:MAG: hypothetical protein ACLFTT_16310 [Candidatus Hydrogenedentota bacterium]